MEGEVSGTFTAGRGSSKAHGGRRGGAVTGRSLPLSPPQPRGCSKRMPPAKSVGQNRAGRQGRAGSQPESLTRVWIIQGWPLRDFAAQLPQRDAIRGDAPLRHLHQGCSHLVARHAAAVLQAGQEARAAGGAGRQGKGR